MSEEVVTLIKCPRCAQDNKIADKYDRHICEDCAKLENSRYMYARQHQGDWMDIAKDAGIDVWLQQPGETQWEYTVWCAYRDSYPGKKPSYNDVAAQLNTTRNVVGKVAQRWTFPARMQAWIAECDRITMQQRRKEILEMNKDHISMAQRLREKISAGIDAVVPETLKPSELATLLKLAADLENKARVDTMAQEEMIRDLSKDVENPNLKRSPTKQDDLSEVVQILMKAGALGSVAQVGVRETTTTTREVVVSDGNGSEARLVDSDGDDYEE